MLLPSHVVIISKDPAMNPSVLAGMSAKGFEPLHRGLASVSVECLESNIVVVSLW